MNCPRCNITLVISLRKGTEIFICPICRDEWFEKGELDEIVEPSEIKKFQKGFNPHNNMINSNDYKPYNYKYHSYLKRKKIKLNEMFDL